ncbi:unnamed protein product [Zymoseptoria tritici ST99CH_3D1]|nr:unnamed protein product [Zymoseptoria tritici ST99CH_3D1]
MCLSSPIHAPEDTADMRKSPSAAQTCSKETAPTVINPKKDNSDCDCNVRNDHGNELEPVPPSAQSAASLDFFSTPELLEMALLLLPPHDILSATRISIQAKKTIAGSSKLQRAIFRAPDHRLVLATAVVRHNPLDHFVAPFSSDAVYAKLCYPPHDGPLLRANPFVFDSPHDLSAIGLLPLTGLVDDLINTNETLSESLGLMFISQPPISHVKLELRCVPVCY